MGQMQGPVADAQGLVEDWWRTANRLLRFPLMHRNYVARNGALVSAEGGEEAIIRELANTERSQYIGGQGGLLR